MAQGRTWAWWGHAGHVHAYERMNPVYNFTLDPCAPVHITVGDGGMKPDRGCDSNCFTISRGEINENGRACLAFCPLCPPPPFFPFFGGEDSGKRADISMTVMF